MLSRDETVGSAFPFSYRLIAFLFSPHNSDNTHCFSLFRSRILLSRSGNLFSIFHRLFFYSASFPVTISVPAIIRAKHFRLPAFVKQFSAFLAFGVSRFRFLTCFCNRVDCFVISVWNPASRGRDHIFCQIIHFLFHFFLRFFPIRRILLFLLWNKSLLFLSGLKYPYILAFDTVHTSESIFAPQFGQ